MDLGLDEENINVYVTDIIYYFVFLPSSSTMVTVAVSSPNITFESVVESVAVNISVSSTTESSVIGTEAVATV